MTAEVLSTAVEIKIGDRWRDDASHNAFTSLSDTPEHLDTSELLDVIDIVLGGDNITALASEDRVVDLMVDLHRGLDRLLNKETSKVIIPFYEFPWELVLIPWDPHHLAISFYSLAPGGPVACHNRPVSIEALTHAVQDAALRLADDLIGLDDTQTQSPKVRQLQTALPHSVTLPPAVAAESSPRSVTIPCGAATLTCTMALGHRDLLDYQGSAPLDLHALLVPGTIALHLDSEAPPVPLCAGYPFHTIRALVSQLRQALHRFERQLPPDTVSPKALKGLLGVLPWSLNVQSRLPGTPEEPPDASVTINAVVESVIALSQDIAAELAAANPAQNDNARLHALLRSNQDLSAWFSDLSEGDVYAPILPTADVPTATEPDPSTNASPRFNFPITDVRRLSLRERWAHAASSIRFISLLDHAGNLLVEIDSAISLLDLDNGSLRWTHPPHEAQDHKLPFTCAGGVFLSSPAHDTIQRLDRRSGEPRWRRTLNLRGQLRSAVWLQAHDTALSIAITSNGELIALRDHDGEPLWHGVLAHGRLHGATVAGGLLVVISKDGFVYGHDPRTGAQRWRLRSGLGAQITCDAQGDRLLLASENSSLTGVRAVCIDARTGKPLWWQHLPGLPTGKPVIHNENLIMCLDQRDKAQAIALDRDTGRVAWSHALATTGLVPPTSPLLAPTGQVIIKTDRDEVVALDCATGAQRWLTHLSGDGQDDVLLMNLPLALCLGAVVVPGSTICLLHPDTGAILHKLSGLPHHPIFLHVTPDLRFIVGEHEDDEALLTCFAVEHFLAVVQN